MFAVIRTGGKQYRVQKDDKILVEKIEAKDGENVNAADVLFLSDGKTISMGDQVSGAKVTMKVLGQKRGPKVVIFKKKRRQNYRRTRGHRQDLTLVQITDIKAA
jgi:large subunit ribosomal protein L21